MPFTVGMFCTNLIIPAEGGREGARGRVFGEHFRGPFLWGHGVWQGLVSVGGSGFTACARRGVLCGGALICFLGDGGFLLCSWVCNTATIYFQGQRGEFPGQRGTQGGG